MDTSGTILPCTSGRIEDGPRTLRPWQAWLLGFGLGIALGAWPFGDARSQTYELRGKIGKPMVDETRDALAKGRRAFTIESPGGYVFPALALGLEIKLAGGSLTAINECSSACVYALCQVPDRYVAPGTKVRIHMPSTDNELTLRLFDDLLKMCGVSAEVIERDARSINGGRPLSPGELAQMGIR